MYDSTVFRLTFLSCARYSVKKRVTRAAKSVLVLMCRKNLRSDSLPFVKDFGIGNLGQTDILFCRFNGPVSKKGGQYRKRDVQIQSLAGHVDEGMDCKGVTYVVKPRPLVLSETWSADALKDAPE